MAKNTERKDGLYRYWYKGKQFYGKTDAEARKKRDDYRYECEHGIEQQKPITVFDLADEWLPVAKAGVAVNTYNQYVSIMEGLTSIVGNKIVSAVTPADIKKVWATMIGMSQSHISKAEFLYKAFFQYAIDNGYCVKNPMLAESAKPHSGTKGTHRCLEPWEVRLVETVPHRCQIAAMFMMKAGLRRGEMLALRKSDIYGELIHVTEAVKFIGNRPVVGDTKNESSVRNVPLFAPLKPFVGMIADYILPSAKGTVCSESAFDRAWQSYMYHLSREAGRKVSFRPHDLRHTFVSDCRDRGIDIHVVMRWCGHSSEKMILEIYDHVSAEREQNAVTIMNTAPGTVKKQLNRKKAVLRVLKTKDGTA